MFWYCKNLGTKEGHWYRHLYSVNPQTYAQSHIPMVVQGGGGWWTPPPWVFDMLQYFETILPSVERSSLQDEVYFMGGGAAGGLWRHQTLSPSWILSRIRNQVKTFSLHLMEGSTPPPPPPPCTSVRVKTFTHFACSLVPFFLAKCRN